MSFAPSECYGHISKDFVELNCRLECSKDVIFDHLCKKVFPSVVQLDNHVCPAVLKVDLVTFALCPLSDLS